MFHEVFVYELEITHALSHRVEINSMMAGSFIIVKLVEC